MTTKKEKVICKGTRWGTWKSTACTYQAKHEGYCLICAKKKGLLKEKPNTFLYAFDVDDLTVVKYPVKETELKYKFLEYYEGKYRTFVSKESLKRFPDFFTTPEPALKALINHIVNKIGRCEKELSKYVGKLSKVKGRDCPIRTAVARDVARNEKSEVIGDLNIKEFVDE